MKISTWFNGKQQDVEVPDRPLLMVVAPSGVKLETTSGVTISPEDTIRHMKAMRQDEWSFISNSPLFMYLSGFLFFHQGIVLPLSVEDLVTKYDNGVIHGCGLIILLAQYFGDGVSPVYLKDPETYLHPVAVQGLMTVITKAQKLFRKDVGKNLGAVV